MHSPTGIQDEGWPSVKLSPGNSAYSVIVLVVGSEWSGLTPTARDRRWRSGCCAGLRKRRFQLATALRVARAGA